MRGGGSAYLLRVGGTGLALGVQILLARVLGLEGYGYYVYAITLTGFLALGGKFGQETALQRFISEYKTKQLWESLRGFMRYSNLVTLVSSVFLAVFLAGVVLVLARRLEPGLLETLLVASLLLPVHVLLQVKLAVLRAFKKIKQALIPQEILRPVLLATGVLFVTHVAGRSPTAAEAMAVNIGAVLVAMVIACLALSKTVPGEVKKARAVLDWRYWTKVSFSLMLVQGFNTVLSHVDILMLGAMVDTETAGIYASASKLSLLISFGVNAINVVAAPVFAELYSNNDLAQLQQFTRKAAAGVLVLAIPSVILIVVTGSWLLGLFGQEFRTGYVALVVLASGQMINAAMGPMAMLMLMTGHQAQTAKILGASVAFNMTLNAVLIALMGIEGAALATALTTALWNMAMLVFVSRKIGVNPTVFGTGQKG